METVSGMDCKVSSNTPQLKYAFVKVFGANNVEIVTKTRTEHMSVEDKQRAKANKNPLLSIFGPQVEWGNCPKSNISAHNRRQRPRLHQVVQSLRKLDLIPWLPSLLTNILLVRRKW